MACSSTSGNAAANIVASQIDVLRDYGNSAYTQAMAAMREMESVFSSNFSPEDSGIGIGGKGNDTGIIDPDHSIEFNKPVSAPVLETELVLPELTQENLLEGLKDLDPLLANIIDQLQALIATMPENPAVDIDSQFLILLDRFYASTTTQMKDLMTTGVLSSIMSSFETTLDHWMRDELIGMPKNAIDALLERAYATEDQQAFRAEDEALTGWLARGFTLPGGALEANLWLIRQQAWDRKGALNRDILIETVKWERETRQVAMETATKYRQEIFDYYFKRQSLAKDIAGTWQEFEIKIKTALIEVYKARIEAWGTAAKALGDMGNAIGVVIKANLDRFSAYLELYKTKLMAAIQVVESDIKIFGSQVDLYKADGQLENWRVAPLLALEQLDLDTSKLKVDLRIKDRELEQQKLLRMAEVTVNALHGIATVAAQLSGAAMGAVNVGATMSDGHNDSNTNNCSTTYNYQM